MGSRLSCLLLWPIRSIELYEAQRSLKCGWHIRQPPRGERRGGYIFQADLISLTSILTDGLFPLISPLPHKPGGRWHRASILLLTQYCLSHISASLHLCFAVSPSRSSHLPPTHFCLVLPFLCCPLYSLIMRLTDSYYGLIHWIADILC